MELPEDVKKYFQEEYESHLKHLKIITNSIETLNNENKEKIAAVILKYKSNDKDFEKKDFAELEFIGLMFNALMGEISSCRISLHYLFQISASLGYDIQVAEEDQKDISEMLSRSRFMFVDEGQTLKFYDQQEAEILQETAMKSAPNTQQELQQRFNMLYTTYDQYIKKQMDGEKSNSGNNTPD